MSQENQAAEKPEPTKEQVVAQIDAYREAIVKSAVENDLSFDVVFNALSQVVASFAFDFLLLTQGELTDANVDATIAKFNSQTEKTAKVGLENMREFARKEAKEAEGPKIITEV